MEIIEKQITKINNLQINCKIVTILNLNRGVRIILLFL